MMTQGIYKILYNFEIAPSVFRMVLEGDTSSLLAPGQFVNIKLEGKYLRRPISVSEYDKKTITIIYKVVGEGTEQMAKMQAGESLDLLVGLGNGFNPEKGGENVIEKKSNKVYSGVLANGNKKTAADIYGDVDYSKYLYVFEITEIPESAADSIIYVRPYVEMNDGTIVYGEVSAQTLNGLKTR